MENEELDHVIFEPKPGFDLGKYGNVFTISFNQEFAQRLNNILVDYHKNFSLQGQPLCFFKMLRNLMEIPGDEEAGELYQSTQFILQRYQHVYTVACEREFAQNLNQILTRFMVQKRVSPALFGFAKQLEGSLYSKRFDVRTRYADELF